jgi:type IV secretory pathway ATPase VirB11/archaellum biosynthesis ATPase
VNRIGYDQKPQVVICPNSRCSDCNSEIGSVICSKQTRIEQRMSQKIIIVEPKDRLVHYSEGVSSGSIREWDTIFINNLEDISVWESLVDSYKIGPYLTVFFGESGSNRIRYQAFPHVKTSLEYSLLHEMESLFKKEFQYSGLGRMNLQQTLNRITEWTDLQISSSLPEINSRTRLNVSEIIAHKSSVLCNLFPLILDEHVEEIYLDRPDDLIYFDHSRLGRVVSNIAMDTTDISRVTTLLRAESNQHLDRKNPSLKTDILIYGVPLRFSVSLPPLSPDGMSLEIRRARIEPFTVLDLIQNRTLTIEAAALLVLAISSRMNITITGEPGSGKTTLMNALDLITPRVWRKVYIEDVLESRIVKDSHQIRYRVDPIEETEWSLSKAGEITKSLHRSPDYMILGEIQTAQHSHALFQSITAGLRSIQTCHSRSPASLITRWNVEHGISRASLALMDVIVSVKQPEAGSSRRYVEEIVEVCRKMNSGTIEFAGINTLYKMQLAGSSMPWSENGAFMESRGGDLVSLSDEYSIVLAHLRESIEDPASSALNSDNILQYY